MRLHSTADRERVHVPRVGLLLLVAFATEWISEWISLRSLTLFPAHLSSRSRSLLFSSPSLGLSLPDCWVGCWLIHSVLEPEDTRSPTDGQRPRLPAWANNGCGLEWRRAAPPSFLEDRFRGESTRTGGQTNRRRRVRPCRRTKEERLGLLRMEDGRGRRPLLLCFSLHSLQSSHSSQSVEDEGCYCFCYSANLSGRRLENSFYRKSCHQKMQSIY